MPILAAKHRNQKSLANFLATLANIFYTVGVMDGSADSKQSATKMMLGFIVRRCAADLGHTPTPDEFAARLKSDYDKYERIIRSTGARAY